MGAGYGAGSGTVGAAAGPVLVARELVRALGTVVSQPVLKGVTLEVAAGDFLALTGASGSGKSTLLYLLGALDRPSSGEVWIEGVEVNRLDDDRRAALRNERLGFVFQFHFLLPEFTVLENVALPMLRRGLATDDAHGRAASTLARLGLSGLEKRRPDQLSGGQQQRVAIARAVAGKPAIILADEPTGALDSANGKAVIELFEWLNHDDGVTLVMVTHDPAFAARARRQVTLRDGQVVGDVRQRP